MEAILLSRKQEPFNALTAEINSCQKKASLLFELAFLLIMTKFIDFLIKI